MMIEGSGSIPLIVGPDPGGPKTCGSGGSGSGTLVRENEYLKRANLRTYFCGIFKLPLSLTSKYGTVIVNHVRGIVRYDLHSMVPYRCLRTVSNLL